jgi:hypothetical protein
MGLIADFFIADAAIAASLNHTIDLPQSDVVSYKRITPLAVSYLKLIMENEPIRLDLAGIKAIRIVDGGECITTEMPADFIDRLANTPDDGIASLAERWAECEEPGWDAGLLAPVILDLRHLAQEAQRRNLGLYPWNCV